MVGTAGMAVDLGIVDLECIASQALRIKIEEVAWNPASLANREEDGDRSHDFVDVEKVLWGLRNGKESVHDVGTKVASAVIAEVA